MFGALLVWLSAVSVVAVSPVAVDDKVALWNCNASSERQQWDYGNGNGSPLTISVRGQTTALVWDIIGPSNDTGTGIHTWGLYEPLRPNQQWRFSGATSTIQSLWGKCLGVEGPAYLGSMLVLMDCASASIFDFDNATGAFSTTAADGGRLCVAAGETANCTTPPFSTYPYCDPSLGPSARAADLAARLEVHDWASILQNANNGIPRFGIPPMAYNEALHGIVYGCGPVYTDATGYTSTGCPTSFPHATLMGGSFNRSLWRAVASAISDEGRALHQTNGYALITWAPDINPFRDPRWGRGQEVAGECPTLVSEYIAEYARGMQEGEDSRCIKLVSTAKHFSGYDLENWGGFDRNSFTANISLHDLVEYFWPPFESATQRGRVHSIMCSYNAVSLDGAPEVPSCAWGWANNEVMRGQWAWDGFIVSDCGAIADISAAHHYAKNYSAAAAAGIRGGTDVNCGSVYAQYIPEAVATGQLDLGDLVTAGTRLLKVAFWTGLFDPPSACAYNRYGPERVDTRAHRALALEAAVQGIVLLQNNPAANSPWGPGTPLLPLRAAGLRGKTVAVIGPHATTTQGLLSIYIGTNTVVNNQSVLTAFQRRGVAGGFAVTTADGCSPTCGNTTGFAAAVATASAADVIVLTVGLYPGGGGHIPDGGPTQEDEGFDRSSLVLPGNQSQLIEAIIATGKPVVLLLIHGGALALDTAAHGVPAIVDAHYPGQMGGDAVAAILFGDASPSGRLTTTVYPATWATQRAMSDYNLAPHKSAIGDDVPGVTYLYYDGPTDWPFGYGLSYTTFNFSWASGGDRTVSPRAFVADGLTPFAVNVTNTGHVVSDVSALAFVTSGVPGEPLQRLFDFQRATALAPGASVTLYFTLPPSLAATVTRHGTRELRAGTRLEISIGDVARARGSPRPSSVVRAQVLLEGASDRVKSPGHGADGHAAADDVVVQYALPPRQT